jgi:formate dehydrogenase (NADP+) beta subunit
LNPTDTGRPDYFHKVVDCQYACPAHTPVPEYIRLIAAGRYGDAYMVNWHSNVFPGILGRVCDRPCEPACRRGRVEPNPVAICRLKRVAADHKEDIQARLPLAPKTLNGKRVVCVGAGPASLTVARDLAVQGYEVTVLDSGPAPGGMVRSQIPKFRLPDSVIDEECNYILNLGVKARFNHWVSSMKDLLAQPWDAVFVGTGAPRGRAPDIEGYEEVKQHVHIGIDWLANVAFGHVDKVAPRVIVLGGGNTAMDCCRSARRLGGTNVKVVVRSGYEEMKASPWEKEDALHEGVEIHNFLVPKTFLRDKDKLTGVRFEKVRAEYDERGKRNLVSTGEAPVDMACDEVLVAIGQDNAFGWIERDLGLEFDRHGMPQLNAQTLQSTLPRVFFGGDSALGPKNIITAVAQGHEAAVSIDRFCRGQALLPRPDPRVTMSGQKMGIHEWRYNNEVSEAARSAVPSEPVEVALKDIKLELELGYDLKGALKEAERCLNCDMQTVFSKGVCIECDACVDICPTECITFTANGDEQDLRSRLKAPATQLDQALYVSGALKTGRVMVKDENVCLHCGMCAERCPTGAWDMQKFFLQWPQAAAQEVKA